MHYKIDIKMDEKLGLPLPSAEERLQWDKDKSLISLTGKYQDKIYLLVTNAIHMKIGKQQQKENRVEFPVEINPSFAKEIDTLRVCAVVLDQQLKLHSIVGGARTDLALPWDKRCKGFAKTEILNIGRPSFDSIDIQSNSEKGRECFLYVTKLWKEVQEGGNQKKMFHEHVWIPEEIEFVMGQVEIGFGQFDGLVQKRRHLVFSFRRRIGDPFWEQWEDLQRQILIRGKGVSGGRVCYYIWSKECLLSTQEMTNTLFQLPNVCKIVDVSLHEPWTVVAAQKYVLFIHIYRPMQHFRHQDNINSSKIKYLGQQQLLLILDKQGLLFCFRLGDKEVSLVKKIQTPFVRPYAVAQIAGGIYISGVDVDSKELKKPALKRRVYKLYRNVFNPMLIVKEGHYESSFDVALAPQSNPLAALSQLEPVTKQLLACSCLNNFYLINLSGHRLIEVQLKSPITRIIPVPFLFNLFNFIILNSQGELIRLGVESYGSTLGSQVQKITGESVDCSFCVAPCSQYQILIAGWKEITRRNYLKEEWRKLVVEQVGQIVHLTSDQTGVVFLVDLQHSYELRYLQL